MVSLIHIKMIIVSCNVKLMSYALGAYVPCWPLLLMMSVTLVNPVKLASSGLEDSPC